MIDKGLAFEYAFLIAAGALILLVLINLRLLLLRRKKQNLNLSEKYAEDPAIDPPGDIKKTNNDSVLLQKNPKKPPLFFSKIRQIFSKILDLLKNAALSDKGVLKRLLRPLAPVARFAAAHKYLLLNLILLPLLGYLIFDMLQSPGVRYIYPTNNQVLSDYSRAVEVEFNRPIFLDTFKPYIHPEIAGDWVIEPVFSWMPFFKRKVKFFPEESMFPNQKIFIYFAGIANTLKNTDLWEFGIDSQSPALPQVVSTSPAKDQADVITETNFSNNLDRNTGPHVSWDLTIEPAVEFDLSEAGQQLVSTFKTKLAQTQIYHIVLKRTPQRYNLESFSLLEKGEPEVVLDLQFTTVKEPLISSFEPSGEGVLVTTPIKVNFDLPMDKQSVEKGFSLEPALAGQISWEHDSILVYSHSGMEKDKTYKVKLAGGILSIKGGLTQKEYVHEFTTIGYVKVTGFSPGSNYSNIKRASNIVVTFNQEVDHAAAQSKFSVSPGIAGSFSWEGNSLIFNPGGNLAYGTNYTIKVASGVKTVNGLDSNTEFTRRFTTELEYFVLNVPVYYQTLRYSCNIVAARMALAYRGVYISTDYGYSLLPKDATPRDTVNNIWGNPYNGFVGDIAGNTDGYGVYWGPVASSLIGRYRSYTIKSGWNVPDLLQEVLKGNPVVIWAHNGYSYAGNVFYWNTPGGTSIRAVTGMHSYVVVGYRGPSDNPTHIILNDSNRGRWTVTTSYFNCLWGYFGNTGIVVY